jgi:hypothetical protein
MDLIGANLFQARPSWSFDLPKSWLNFARISSRSNSVARKATVRWQNRGPARCDAPQVALLVSNNLGE